MSAESRKKENKSFNISKFNYKEFTIPKKNGKERKICAPNKELLSYQRSRLKHLMKIYFRMVNNTSVEQTAHGFLSGRNVITAARKHIGYQSTIMMDISNFFDSVYKDMVIGVNTKHLLHKDGYCAQGFATSPILANIAIVPVLIVINEELEKLFSDFAFTIYADDIQISINKTDKHSRNIIISLVRKALKQYGFELNEKKTRVKFAKYGWRRILGVNVGETGIRATRKTMRKIRAARHAENNSSLGGLINWSNCNLPNGKQKRKDFTEDVVPF